MSLTGGKEAYEKTLKVASRYNPGFSLSYAHLIVKTVSENTQISKRYIGPYFRDQFWREIFKKAGFSDEQIRDAYVSSNTIRAVSQ
jgi:hypothetical protein